MPQEASSCKPLQPPRVPRAREEAENLVPEQQAILKSLDLSINRVDDEIEGYLKEALRDSKATPPRSRVIIIRAPWGYGKTHYGKHVIPGIANKLGMHYIYVTMENLLEQAYNEFIAKTHGSTPIQYERISAEAELAVRSVLGGVILGAVNEARERGASAAVVFIDEIEAILEAAQHRTQRTVLRSYLASLMLNELLRVVRLLLHSEATKPYAEAVGKVHLILAATPEAYNSIMSLAERMGIGGRLARRVEVVRLLPLSKGDTLKVVKAIMENYYKIPEGSWSPGIVNAIHAASGGNLGIVIKIVNLLVHEASIECKHIHDKDCVCSLTEPRLLVKLMKQIELPYTPRGGYEALVNRDIASKALETEDDTLAKLVAFLEPLSSEDAYTYEVFLASYGLRLYPIRLYHGDCERVYAALDQAARRLADRTSTPVVDSRAAMDELLHIEPGGDCSILVPENMEDYVEVAVLFSNSGLRRVSRDALREALNELEEAAYNLGLERRDAYAVKPSTLPVLYPPAAVRAIPVIRDPEAAAELYNEVRELRVKSPKLYGELVAKGLWIILNLPESLDTPRNTVKTELKLEIYGTFYAVPGFIEYYEEGIQLFSIDEKKLAPENPVVLVRAYSPPGVKPQARPLSKAHQVLDVELTPQDAETLAALAYALLEKPDEYRGLIDVSAVEDLARRLLEQVQRSQEPIANTYMKYGIAVPPFLTTTGKDGDELLNMYRLLLFAADNRGIVDPQEASMLLYYAYRIRPYKGRSKKWCDVEVPPIVILDLEAEDHRAYYDDERRRAYLDNLRERLVGFLREALEANLATRTGNHYRLVPHPVERRLDELAKRGLLSRGEASQYFLLPSEPSHRAAASKVLATLMSIAEARRKALQTPDRRELAKLETAAARARELSSKELPCMPHGPGDTAYLAILKERGAKLIEPSTVEEVAEHLLKASHRHHLAPLMAPLLIHYTEIIDKGLSHVKSRIESLVRRAFNARQAAEALRTELLKLNVASSVELGARLGTITSKESVCREVAHALEKAKKLYDIMRTTPPSSFSKAIKPEKLFRQLRFDECNNKYYFMPLVFYLFEEMQLEEQLQYAEHTLKKIQTLLDKISDILNDLPKDAKIEADKLIDSVHRKKLVIDVDGNIINVLNNIIKGLEDISKKYKKCIELREKAYELLNKANDILENTLNISKYAKNFANKVLLLAEKAGLSTYIDKLNEVASQIYEIEDEINKVKDEITKHYDVVNDTPCTLFNELEIRVNYTHNIYNSANSIERKINETIENIRNTYENIKSKLLAQLDPLRSLATRIEKLLDITRNLKAIAEASRALEEYKSYEQRFLNIVELKEEPKEGPKHVLEKARASLNRAYESLKQAIIEDVGETGYRVLEHLLRHPLDRSARLSEVVDRIAEATKIPKSDIVGALYILDSRGYISFYLSASAR